MPSGPGRRFYRPLRVFYERPRPSSIRQFKEAQLLLSVNCGLPGRVVNTSPSAAAKTGAFRQWIAGRKQNANPEAIQPRCCKFANFPRAENSGR